VEIRKITSLWLIKLALIWTSKMTQKQCVLPIRKKKSNTHWDWNPNCVNSFSLGICSIYINTHSIHINTHWMNRMEYVD
jgi:hypothetical protein